MKAEKFARRFAENAYRNEVRVEVRSPHIFVSRLRCHAPLARCEGSVDAAVSPSDPRRRPEKMPDGVPEHMLDRVREAVRNAARWCVGRVGWRIPCRSAFVRRAGACRGAPLASGSWIAWFCALGASVRFGGPNRKHDAAYVSVKKTGLRTVRDGAAVFAVRLRSEPREAARPVLGALRYEARCWGLRLAVLPRSKVDQCLDAATSLYMRQEGRAWRRRVQSGKYREDLGVLVPTGGGAA